MPHVISGAGLLRVDRDVDAAVESDEGPRAIGVLSAWSSPAFVESDNWIRSCHGPDLSLLELYWCKHLKGTVTTLAVVEDLEIFEDRVR